MRYSNCFFLVPSFLLYPIDCFLSVLVRLTENINGKQAIYTRRQLILPSWNATFTLHNNIIGLHLNGAVCILFGVKWQNKTNNQKQQQHHQHSSKISRRVHIYARKILRSRVSLISYKTTDLWNGKQNSAGHTHTHTHT